MVAAKKSRKRAKTQAVETCMVKGCDAPVHSRKLCKNHGQQIWLAVKRKELTYPEAEAAGLCGVAQKRGRKTGPFLSEVRKKIAKRSSKRKV